MIFKEYSSIFVPFFYIGQHRLFWLCLWYISRHRNILVYFQSAYHQKCFDAVKGFSAIAMQNMFLEIRFKAKNQKSE